MPSAPAFPKRYAIDVLTDAGAGAVIGWYVPALARTVETGRSSQLSIQPSLGPATGVTILWAWQ
jgi:hypothetical protein